MGGDLVHLFYCVYLLQVKPLANIWGTKVLLREPQIWETGSMDLDLALPLTSCVPLEMSPPPPTPKPSASSSASGDDG